MLISNAVMITNVDVGLAEAGIDTVDFEAAAQYLESSNPSVVGVHCRPGNYKSLITILLREKRKNPRKQIIVLHHDLNPQQLAEIHNLLHPYRMRDFKQKQELQNCFQECFSHYYELEQSEKLAELINEKNEELKRLTIQLERSVEERQDQLEQSRRKNASAEKRLNILKKTLVQIYQSHSISEIEKGLASALKDEFAIAWVSIRRPSQSNVHERTDAVNHYKVTLKSGKEDFGHLYFFSATEKSFSSSTKKFLGQVAEAVSLSIKRTFEYQHSQELKRQWEATFDAISDPICLTDKDYNILRVNSSFVKKIGEDSDHHVGQKCYTALFGRETPCEGCHRGELFQLRNPSPGTNAEVFDVYSNNLGEGRQDLYFQMYRDITQDLNLQRQVIETAKMAELGTISSSIAHELNNPIGGMLNFIQLMKMDLTGDEEFYKDVLEIEKGAQKCKTIVQNLLGFSRKAYQKDPEVINLVEVVEQAIKITELKTRAIGIEIQFEHQQQEIPFLGRFNLLAHAIRNILQNAQESLLEKRKSSKGFQGLILLTLRESSQSIEIEISDNGLGIEKEFLHKIFDPLFTTKDPETNPGLGLTLALQIVKEHKGRIEVSTDKEGFLSFKIRFPRPEVQSKEVTH